MINIKKIKIFDIIVDEKFDNKTATKKVYDKLKNQIKKYGELVPLLVNETEDGYYLIDGFKRYNIYLDLEMEYCHVNVLKIRDLDAKMIKISLDTQDEYDVLKTAKMLIALKEKYSMEQIEPLINFNKKQIEKYQSIYEWDWELFSKDNIPSDVKNSKGIKSSYKNLF